MKNVRVSNYELRGEWIVSYLTDGKQDCEYNINRAAYEQWLTDGTGVVDMSICYHEGNVMREVPIKETIENYWLQGVEIDNSPILQDIRMYLMRDEASVSALKAEFVEEHLKQLFTQMEPALRAEAYASLLEYGMLKKEYGEQHASIVFKKILTGNAA